MAVHSPATEAIISRAVAHHALGVAQVVGQSTSNVNVHVDRSAIGIARGGVEERGGRRRGGSQHARLRIGHPVLRPHSGPSSNGRALRRRSCGGVRIQAALDDVLAGGTTTADASARNDGDSVIGRPLRRRIVCDLWYWVEVISKLLCRANLRAVGAKIASVRGLVSNALGGDNKPVLVVGVQHGTVLHWNNNLAVTGPAVSIQHQITDSPSRRR
mmetsp:Transcript_8406/g.18406  ORF Transcript_8406/g.18406 Transcript_8406/m.18406 type:complete len:215 (-) Transcript_8406:1810-2454(-)